MVRRSFDKRGIIIKKRGILQSMNIKKPLEINYEKDSINSIIEKIQYSIEQHPSLLKVVSEKEIKAQKKVNTKREW